ncbi:MAG: MBL fold metallo-hydrolase [Coriobacteriia bacterium]
MTHGLRVTFLGSGSGGNATLVTSGATAVLVDCGFSARETCRRLAEAGADPYRLSAVFLTHEHVDHVSGVRVLAKRTGTRVFASDGTADAARLPGFGVDHERLREGVPVRIGDLTVLPLAVSHDAAEPLGFVFETVDGTRLGLVTDTGTFTASMFEALAGCHVLALETNHDLDMLARGPYPWPLKRRISSAVGHLSNDDAAAAVTALAHDGLRAVVGVHVSGTNNTHGLAAVALRRAMRETGLAAKTLVAAQDDLVWHDCCM